MRILQLAGYFFPEKTASIYLTDNRLDAFSRGGLLYCGVCDFMHGPFNVCMARFISN